MKHSSPPRPSPWQRLRRSGTSSLVALALTQAALAVNVNPGATEPLSGTTSAANPNLAGTVIRDRLHPFVIRDLSNNVVIQGDIQEGVARSTNLGTLIFEYRLRNLSGPAGARITGVQRTGFRGVATDADWRIDGLGDVGPDSVTRSSDGDELLFTHDPSVVDPPDDGRFTNILTDVPDFDLTGSITIYARPATGIFTYRTIISNVASPGVLAVNPGQSIQSAIDHALPGDTVSVAPGTYVENLTLRSDVNVAGAGPGETILQGTGSGDVVTASNVTDSEFTGFTVEGSGPGNSDSGFRISGGSPLIKGNTVRNNVNGIRITSGSNAIICGNTVQDNGDDANGIVDWGIIVLGGSTPLLSNNLVLSNEVGIYLFPATTSGTQIINNTVADNTGDGIWCNDSAPTIKNNLVINNTPGISGLGAGATPALTYNNVWNNQGFGNYNPQGGASLSPGIGSLSEDPLVGSGFELLEGSPCIDAGDPAAIYNDLDGSRNDIGATGGPCSVSAPTGSVLVGYLWTSVGNIPVSEIEQNSGSPKAGLTLDRDRPFGGTTWLYGPFGVQETAVRFYAVRIGKWNGGSPPSFPADYEYLDQPLSKVRYTVSGGSIVATNTSVGPLTVGSSPPVYSLTINSASGYWAHENLRLQLNTAGLENGRYNLRMQGFDIFGNPVVLGGLTPTLTLHVNNTRPTVSIDAVSFGGGAPFDECSIIDLPSATSTLDFTYTARHPDGFLDNYDLVALVGRNRSGGTITSDNYSNHLAANGQWTGVSGAMVAATPVSPEQPLPNLQLWETCAYQFRVRAWARTTNGFGRIYRTTFFDNYALDLEPPVQCSPDLDGDGDVDADDLAIFAAAYGTAQ